MFALSGAVMVLSIYSCIQESTFSTMRKANNILINDHKFLKDVTVIWNWQDHSIFEQRFYSTHHPTLTIACTHLDLIAACIHHTPHHCLHPPHLYHCQSPLQTPSTNVTNVNIAIFSHFVLSLKIAMFPRPSWNNPQLCHFYTLPTAKTTFCLWYWHCPHEIFVECSNHHFTTFLLPALPTN